MSAAFAWTICEPARAALNPLQQVRVVLVHTSHPGNIGAAARAMKTMGLARLELVTPRSFPDAEAAARASGADDILDRARVHGTLAAAIADCQLVLGTTARSRTLAWPTLEPRAAAALALEHAAAGERVALVFGREKSGLSNAELDLCHAAIHIPTAPDYGSLNLAAAVQVLAYELYLASLGERPPPKRRDEAYPPATAAEMAGFFTHLEETLTDIGFLNPAQPRLLMRRLRRLFQRARPDRNEINILRGVLSAVQAAARSRSNT